MRSCSLKYGETGTGFGESSQEVAARERGQAVDRCETALRGPAGACLSGMAGRRGKAKWADIIEHLAHLGLLARIDGDPIAQYCDAWSRWKSCVLWLREHGLRYETQKERGGGVMYRLQPEVSEARQLTSLMIRLDNDMGMTPASRHRMSAVPPGEQGDEFDRWVKQQEARFAEKGLNDASIPGTTAWVEATGWQPDRV